MEIVDIKKKNFVQKNRLKMVSLGLMSLYNIFTYESFYNAQREMIVENNKKVIEYQNLDVEESFEDDDRIAL